MNKKTLDEIGFEGLRRRFYYLLSQLAHYRHDAPALAAHAEAELKARDTKGDKSRWQPALEGAILFHALSLWSSTTADALARFGADARIDDIGAAFRELRRWLTTHEIIPWPLPAPHAAALAAHGSFSIDLMNVGGASASKFESVRATAAAADAAAKSTLLSQTQTAPLSSGAAAPAARLPTSLTLLEDEPRGVGWWPILQKRVAQHNLRVAASAYARIQLPRLGAIVGLDAPTLEAQLAELVATGDISARIDRPAGLVAFGALRPADAILSDWAADLDQCLHKLETAVHLIHKETQKAALVK